MKGAISSEATLRVAIRLAYSQSNTYLMNMLGEAADGHFRAHNIESHVSISAGGMFARFCAIITL